MGVKGFVTWAPAGFARDVRPTQSSRVAPPRTGIAKRASLCGLSASPLLRSERPSPSAHADAGLSPRAEATTCATSLSSPHPSGSWPVESLSSSHCACSGTETKRRSGSPERGESANDASESLVATATGGSVPPAAGSAASSPTGSAGEAATEDRMGVPGLIGSDLPPCVEWGTITVTGREKSSPRAGSVLR